VHPASAVFDEHQDVQPFQQDGIDVQEVPGEDPGGLSVQELPVGCQKSACLVNCGDALGVSRTA
jgi:hypothetical protein